MYYLGLIRGTRNYRHFGSSIKGHVKKTIDKFQPESSSSVRLEKQRGGYLFCCFIS